MLPSLLQIAFQKNPHLISSTPSRISCELTCWWTSGPYYHSALLFPSGELFEAVAGSGVHCVNNPRIDPEMWDLYTLGVKPEVVAEMRAFAVRQLGDPYDWASLIWSQVLMHPRSHPNAWYCSEYNAATLELGYQFPEDPCTYSPNSLYRYLRGAGFIDTVSAPLSH